MKKWYIFVVHEVSKNLYCKDGPVVATGVMKAHDEAEAVSHFIGSDLYAISSQRDHYYRVYEADYKLR